MEMGDYGHVATPTGRIRNDFVGRRIVVVSGDHQSGGALLTESHQRGMVERGAARREIGSGDLHRRLRRRRCSVI